MSRALFARNINPRSVVDARGAFFVAVSFRFCFCVVFGAVPYPRARGAFFVGVVLSARGR